LRSCPGLRAQAAFAPRRCEAITKAKKIFAIIALFVMGPALLFVGGRDWIHFSKLRDHGQTTIGKVTETSYWRRKFWTDYHIRADFVVEARQFSEKFEVSEADYERAKAERTITVHYLPEDPGVAAAGAKLTHKYMFLLTGAAMLFGAVFLVVTFKQPLDEEEAAETLPPQQPTFASVSTNTCRQIPKNFRSSTTRGSTARSRSWKTWVSSFCKTWKTSPSLGSRA
jgi:hypothetical protein